MKSTPHGSYRHIPSVDKLLCRPELASLIEESSRTLVTSLVRRVLSLFRQELSSGIAKAETAEQTLRWILERLQTEFQRITRPSLKKVINATGVVLHTNLGRAPLSRSAIQRIAETAGGYCNLEYDLERGLRGNRDVHVGGLLAEILGCEQVLTVNNNAAAVFLILNTLAFEGEVLISRGELVEIGDSFRIPDILHRSGAILREVGTTNKTRLADYQQALNEKTRMVLRVHPSNFRMIGFTSRPHLPDLVTLCRAAEILLVEDVGSGYLMDKGLLPSSEEPSMRESLSEGADVVCSSADKLMGGPQAGIIAGKQRHLQMIRRNPLFRALRIDKLSLAALQETLLSYLKNRESVEIPLVRMIHLPVEAIGRRAEALAAQLSGCNEILEISLVNGLSMIGGGSAPEVGLPTRMISLQSRYCSASEIESSLRQNQPPILCRVEKNSVLLDLRTVFPDEEPWLVEALTDLSRSVARR